MICPDCNEIMDYALEDGAGDYGDGVDEVYTCTMCGYEARRTAGSDLPFKDSEGYFIEMEDEADDN